MRGFVVFDAPEPEPACVDPLAPWWEEWPTGEDPGEGAPVWLPDALGVPLG